MTKRKKAKKTGKTRVELRLDDEVFAGVKELADAAGISLNQLMQALARWAAKEAKLGDAVRDGQCVTKQAVPQEGSLWFGEEATRRMLTGKARKKAEKEVREQGIDPNAVPDTYFEETANPGIVYAEFDFTERRVVKTDD